MSFYAEDALFGAHQGLDEPHELYNLFRTGQDPSFKGSHLPWGVDHIGRYLHAEDVGPMGEEARTPGFRFASIDADGTSNQPSSIWDLEAALHNGIQTLAAGEMSRGEQPVACSACGGCEDAGPLQPSDAYLELREQVREGIIQEGCPSCHAPVGTVGPPWGLQLDDPDFWDRSIIRGVAGPKHGFQPLVVPGDPESSAFLPIAAEMRATSELQSLLRDWVVAMPQGEGCDTCQPAYCDPMLDVDPDAAFAFLSASSVVNEAFDYVFGERLTLPNHYPRNTSQRDILEQTTRSFVRPRAFGQPKWSLKRLLAELLSDRLFNRTAVADDVYPPTVAEPPYELPLVVDPWVPSDPRTGEVDPERSANAASEAVHRMKPWTIMTRTAAALKWPPPSIQPAGDPLWTRELYLSFGQRLAGVAPGFDDVNSQALLAWEQAVGSCRHPEVSKDWISELTWKVFIRIIYGQTPTWQDVLVAVKSRLLADSCMSDDERQAVETWLQIPLDAPVSGPLEDVARAYCGALLTTPQFATVGVAPRDTCERPVLEDSTYNAHCESLVEALGASGDELSCKGGKAHVVSIAPRLIDQVGTLCGVDGGACSWVDFKEHEGGCSEQPEMCLTAWDLGFDPRCVGLGCQGSDLSELPANASGAAIIWLDGAKVLDASLVEVLRKGKWYELTGGSVLATGDWLRLHSGGTLHVKNGKTWHGFPKTVPARKDAWGKLQPWLVRVTGPSELLSSRLDATAAKLPALPASAMEAWHQLPAYRHGPGGRRVVASKGGDTPKSKTK